MFSKKVQEAKVAYTFDDFLLTPNASYVEPKDIDTKIKLGKDIKLNIPILSAAMDTVTDGTRRWCWSNSQKYYSGKTSGRS